MIRISILTALFLAIFIGKGFSQDVLPPVALEVHMAVMDSSLQPPDSIPQQPDSLYITQADSLMGTLVIILQDSSSIDSIHMKMGTTEGGSELLSQVIHFDPVSLPDGFTYQREGLVLRIGIGWYVASLNQYFAEAWLENTSGSLSTSVVYYYSIN